MRTTSLTTELKAKQVAYLDADEAKVNVDKRGRICDTQGRPLRDRATRNFSGPFKGRDGEPQQSARLEARQAEFDGLRADRQAARKRPGSWKK